MNIDFKLLADQKLELVGLAMENQSGTKELEAGFLTKKQEYALDGVINLLDAIEDEQEDIKALSSPAKLKEKWMNKLEESKNTPRKFQPHDTAWDFVEEYYPNYSSSDDICRAQDLHIEIFDNNNASKELDEEYTYLMKIIYEQAIENFIQSQNK